MKKQKEMHKVKTEVGEEIMLLVDQSDCAVPLFDTTGLHALAAVDAALAD